jgi:hypothetical protein
MIRGYTLIPSVSSQKVFINNFVIVRPISLPVGSFFSPRTAELPVRLPTQINSLFFSLEVC